jgi:hypothetical protein
MRKAIQAERPMMPTPSATQAAQAGNARAAMMIATGA